MTKLIQKWGGWLFALWLLLIPLPLYLPIFELDYQPYYIQFSSFSLYPNQAIAAVLLLGGWVYSGGRLNLRPYSLTIPLLALTCLTFVSMFTAHVDGQLSTIQLGRLLIALSLVFALKNLVLPAKSIYLALLLFLIVQGIAATLQFGLQNDLGLWFLGEADIEPLPGRGSIIFGPNETYWLRSYGLAPHPNILGGFVASALCAALFWQDGESPAVSKWLLMPALFLGTLALLFPFSRSAWLGAGLGIGFGLKVLVLSVIRSTQPTKQGWLSLSKLGSQLKKLIPLGLAIILFWIMARPAIQARSQPLPNQTVTQSVGERQLLQELAFEFISDNRVLGLGAGNFGPAMLDHPNRETFPNIHPVHNVPLLLTAELGFFGGAIWIWLMLAPAGIALLAAWHGRLTPELLGCVAALLALAAVDLFDYYSWGWPHGLTWRWMWFALLAANLQTAEPPFEPDLPAV